jgi:hypothetical protein
VCACIDKHTATRIHTLVAVWFLLDSGEHTDTACRVTRDITQRWHERACKDQEKLSYLSLGAGGLFADLLVLGTQFTCFTGKKVQILTSKALLAGLLARGVPISTVVLVDTIYEELIVMAQRHAQHTPRYLIYLLHWYKSTNTIYLL